MATSFRTVSLSLLCIALLLGLTAGTASAAPPAQPPDGIYHTVRWGETLTAIAYRYGTTVEAIAQANNIRNPSYVHAGVRLLIPSSSLPSEPSDVVTYTVRRGDNLTVIAARHGTTVEAITKANNIRNPSMIYVGMILSIPSASSPVQVPAVSSSTPQPSAPSNPSDQVTATPVPEPAPVLAPPPTEGPLYYTVRWGDTLTSIASRYGTTVEAIVQANNIWNPSFIHAGARLRIPRPPTTAQQAPSSQPLAISPPSATATPAPPPPTEYQPPVMPPSQLPTPTSPPVPVIAVCNPQTSIVYPPVNTVLDGWGTTWIKGTASIDDFQFYKLEYGIGEVPLEWFGIGEVYDRPIVNGILGTWNTGALPEGVYQLRLVVVDNRGQFPPPCQVRVVVDHGAAAMPPLAPPAVTPVPSPTADAVTAPAPIASTALSPTPVPAPTPTPTAGSQPAMGTPALCNPRISITYPPVNAVLDGWGTTWIKGTASIDDFQFYKLEYGIGEAPIEWFGIGDVQTRPIVNGILGTWNTGALPEGVYQLRLVVVDNRGQFPPPCQVRVVVDHDTAVPPVATPVPSAVAGISTAPSPVPPTLAPTPALVVGIPALCNPRVSITYPTVNAVLNGWGTTWIKGTASIDDFQFYKLEYGIGEAPFEWFGIGEVYDRPIVNGILGTWNTGALPEGVYQLRLVVVDNRGQFPPPCQVRVVVDHSTAAVQPSFPLPPPPVATPVPSPVTGLWPAPPPVPPAPAPAPTPAPELAIPALCNPKVSIVYPTVNAVLDGWGTTWIKGTASIDDFQFYKLEYGIGEAPFQWFSIGEVETRPIVNGILGMWNTGALPTGVYQLRLVAVDNRGQFPPPCTVRVIVSH